MAYLTIAEPTVAEQKIKRSRFLCSLFPISSEAEAKTLIARHNEDFADATHNCFAYLCGFKREIQYYSDAGEPHGTAGKPILGALLRNGLTNVLAIVTRYYGGVKLGTRGLIDAYGETAELAVAAASRIAAVALAWVEVVMDYAQVDPVKNLVRSQGGEIAAEEWSERAKLTLRLPEEHLSALLDALAGLKTNTHLEYCIKEN